MKQRSRRMISVFLGVLSFCIALTTSNFVWANGTSTKSTINAVKAQQITKTATSKALAKRASVSGKGTATGSRVRRSGLISLNFQKISTRAALQLVSKASGMNFVISDSVKGSMSLHLTKVPWKEAFNIILKANGLGYRRFGKIMLVSPVNDLADNEIMELQAKQKVAQLAPLRSELIRLRYANADEIAQLLKGDQSSLLSPRGQVGADHRTNTLWLRDTAKHIAEAKKFIKRLDIPARQVLIEAKIVSIDDSYAKDLGVRFGVSNPSWRLQGKLNDNPSLADRLNFDLPAASTSRPGSIALSMLSLGGRTILDLELSALEEEGHAEVISSPRIITSNQQPAMIQQGEEIPYLESTSSGATSVSFRKAVLSLEITPQITPDDNIILTVRVTQNRRGEQIVATSNGDVNPLLPPAINTNEVESQVFLKNTHTVVIGGIYQTEKSTVVKRIPFFGKLPLLGYLFMSKSTNTVRKQLIVMITPRIIEQEAH